jgi:ABC-type transport system substrate-binding protein/class 3 adenylate cyclase/streptogramin lyase
VATDASGGVRAFLITDVRGYTRFTQQHGDEAAARLAARFAGVVEEVVGAYGGSVVEVRGDEALISFISPREALRAAVALQQRCADETRADPSLPLRIGAGLDVGEAVALGEGYRGGALNVAARLCARAGPGVVLLTDSVARLTGRVENIALTPVSRMELKGLDEPVRVLQAVFPLDLPPEEGAPPRWARRRLIGLGAAAALVAGAVAAALITVLGGSSPHRLLTADAVGMLSDRTGSVTAQVPVPGRPSAVAVGSGSVWVTDAVNGVVREIDPSSVSVIDSIPVGTNPDGVVVGGGGVWVANGDDRTVSWISPSAGRVVKTIRVGNGPAGITYGEDAVWVVNQADGTVQRVDPRSGTAGLPIPVAPTPAGVAVGGGSVWVADQSSGTVVRLDGRTSEITSRVPVGNGPTGLTFGGGYLWIANAPDGTVTRLDPRSGELRKISVGRDPEALTYVDGKVWVADELGGALVRIDARTLSAKRVPVGSDPHAVSAGGGRLWVAALASGASHRGGTMRLVVDRTLTSVDPSSYYPPYFVTAYYLPNWQVASITNDGLVAYRKVGGVAGATIVPDLATALPQPGEGGRSYTFQLRQGIRYSTGRLVRASDFRYGAERQFRAGTQGTYFTFDTLLGSAACLRKPKACSLAKSITTDDAAGTVTYHLAKPDPAFLYKLALPFGDAVPPGSPSPTSNKPLPATGPYKVARWVPGKELLLVRNPSFRQWSAAAQPDGYPDRLHWTLRIPAHREVTQVERGEADVMLERVPPDRVAEVQTRYANLSHPFSFPVTAFFFLNTRVPPFDRVQVRRAINFALDRNRIVQIQGGPRISRPDCQVLPPNMPGYRPYCPYTIHPNPSGTWTGPDLPRARALIAASGTEGMRITVWATPTGVVLAQTRYFVDLLNRLGYRAGMKIVKTSEAYFTSVDDSKTRAQTGSWSWIQDYPNPIDFIVPTLSCDSFLPRDPNNLNVSEFCDRRISREIEEASALQQADPARATALWAKIDRELTDLAPWVVIAIRGQIDLVSARVGNYQHSPQSGILIDRLWVK